MNVIKRVNITYIYSAKVRKKTDICKKKTNYMQTKTPQTSIKTAYSSIKKG